MRPLPLSSATVGAIAAIVLAATVLLVQAPRLVSAVFTPALDEETAAQRLAEYLKQHEADLQLYRGRFDGRSPFFIPPAPPPDRPKIVERGPVGPPPPPPPPPGPPRDYMGPSVVFVLGNEVYFGDGIKRRVGQEIDGVKVLESNPPWWVKIGHDGGEYTIELFERTFPGLESQPPPQPPTPGVEVVKAEPAPGPEGPEGEDQQQP